MAASDVQAVERELSALWKDHAGAVDNDEDEVVMRARVLNLMIYVPTEPALREVNVLLRELTAAHPCRALVMLGDAQAPDQDIEMFVSTFCLPAAVKTRTHLCCEQVTLSARGRFVAELPSAAIPLLVSDLPVFLWWRDAPRLEDQIFTGLNRAADRVIIDSAEFQNPHHDLVILAALLQREHEAHEAISDLNWGRLTSWRALLASFYDVKDYRQALDLISRVCIQYVAPQQMPSEIPPQPLILAGWLASRLGWRLASGERGVNNRGGRFLSMEKDGRRISIEFSVVKHRRAVPGQIVGVELRADSEPPASFSVSCGEDGPCFKTHASFGDGALASRTLSCEDEREAVLLGRELEILCRSRVYEDAVAAAAEMIREMMNAATMIDEGHNGE